MKMNRLLLLAVAILTALFTAGATASDEIPLPSAGVSAEVATPHVTANLILSQGMYITGQPLTAVIHLKMEQDWHTYWVNPGEAGLATRVKWTFAKGSGDGIVPGDIQWPSPEIHAMGPIVTYGYGSPVTYSRTHSPQPRVPSASSASTTILSATLRSVRAWPKR